jgi:hypothetical protein
MKKTQPLPQWPEPFHSEASQTPQWPEMFNDMTLSDVPGWREHFHEEPPADEEQK